MSSGKVSLQSISLEMEGKINSRVQDKVGKKKKEKLFQDFYTKKMRI